MSGIIVIAAGVRLPKAVRLGMERLLPRAMAKARPRLPPAEGTMRYLDEDAVIEPSPGVTWHLQSTLCHDVRIRPGPCVTVWAYDFVSERYPEFSAYLREDVAYTDEDRAAHRREQIAALRAQRDRTEAHLAALEAEERGR